MNKTIQLRLAVGVAQQLVAVDRNSQFVTQNDVVTWPPLGSSLVDIIFHGGVSPDPKTPVAKSGGPLNAVNKGLYPYDVRIVDTNEYFFNGGFVDVGPRG